jgi:hypothetical protein
MIEIMMEMKKPLIRVKTKVLIKRNIKIDKKLFVSRN